MSNLYTSSSSRRQWVAVLVTLGLTICNVASASTDDMNERLRACAGCHDRVDTGVNDDAYAPSIAGKPVEYLYQQLLNFREGRRLNTVMNQMLAYLSADYLHEIAAYYAQQQTHHREAEQIEQSAEQTERTRYLVQQNDGEQPACSACHGGDLRGNGVAIPSLRGLSATYITAQLGAWQADTRRARQPDCMREVAKSLSGADIEAVAQWIAAVDDSQLETAPPMQPLPVPCGAVQ